MSRNDYKYNRAKGKKCAICSISISNYATWCKEHASQQHSIRMSGSGNSMFGTNRAGKDNPYYGKKHTEEIKTKMHKPHGALTKEHIEKIRLTSLARPPMSEKTRNLLSVNRTKYLLTHGGHIPRILYKEIYFRSSWEVAYAKWLDSKSIYWEYECKTFEVGHRHYTPDFYIPAIDTYVEIKGWFKKEAKEKFTLFKKQYPNIDIMLLLQKDLKELGII